ncbi:phasin family protein [Kaustia mangrovi]|uniref:Phasin family protein n=1 Tax=Kaustia mangrovi TaxID=2593653 RepID=A0A7S8C1G7_9HYPH|nr:phasin family protein [Kaustia mangrovi]QPC41634.1 phasin family protein [Kaustia mangrovi]
MIKSFEDFQIVGKDNFDASVASVTAMTKGFQTMAAEMADYSRKALEESTKAVETVMAAKSVDKAVEAQQTFAKQAYEGYLGEMNKLGEIYLNAAKEAYKPFEAQLAQFNGKVAGK